MRIGSLKTPSILGIILYSLSAAPTYAWADEDYDPVYLPGSCAQVDGIDSINEHPPGEFRSDDFTEWHLTSQPQARGTAILVHGLNLRPSAMSDLVEEYNNQGYDVLRVALRGHRGNLDEYETVYAAYWRKDIFFAYCLAEQHARLQSGKLIGVGFSLGGLILESLLNETQISTVKVDGMVLYAPAIDLKFFASWVKIFRIFGRRFNLPSAGVPELRAHTGTPIAAYDSLFEILEELEARNFKRSKIPTLIFGNPDDPIVDVSDLEKISGSPSYPNWKFVSVTNDGGDADGRGRPHLIIRKSATGLEQWSKMSSEIGSFLDSLH